MRETEPATLVLACSEGFPESTIGSGEALLPSASAGGDCCSVRELVHISTPLT